MILTCKKKPILVEAVQYTDDTRDFIIEWCPNTQHVSVDEDGIIYELKNLIIHYTTIGSISFLCPGDYLVKDYQDRFTIVPKETFEKTYEVL